MLRIRCGYERAVKDDHKVFSLSNWKDGRWERQFHEIRSLEVAYQVVEYTARYVKLELRWVV